MNKEDQQLLIDLDGAVREDLFQRIHARLLAMSKFETYLRQDVIPELECVDEYAKELEEFLPDDHNPIAPRLKKALEEMFK